MTSYREMSNKAKDERRSPTPDAPNKLRGGQRKKKPEKEWYVVGTSLWDARNRRSKERVLHKAYTEEDAERYIEKVKRSFISDYTQSWRAMHKGEWIASQEDSCKEDPQQAT